METLLEEIVSVRLGDGMQRSRDRVGAGVRADETHAEPHGLNIIGQRATTCA